MTRPVSIGAVISEAKKAGYESPSDTTARLAKLSLFDYELVRDEEAKKLGTNFRVSVLDEAVRAARGANLDENEKATMFPKVELWHNPVDGAELLDEIKATVHRFIICEPETAIAATLWCAFTWLIDSVQVAPLAVITAPEKRCGKTQLLTLIGKLSRDALPASNISPSAVFRVIEAHRPTLLIDEADSFFKENEELRGIINSGHTRDFAFVIRNVGDDHEPTHFSTWGAKAISGIGHLAETLMDRAIVLELRRKRKGERVERLRKANAGLFDVLRSKLARFAQDAAPVIERAEPALPDALHDRAQDNWEPLLAIADHARGEWPDLARSTSLKLSGSEQEAISLSTELLTDILEVFNQRGTDRISTADLLMGLCEDESRPWAGYNRGQAMRPHQLARMLKDFKIKPNSIRTEYGTPKGYMRSWFADAFARYLIPSNSLSEIGATPATTQQAGGELISMRVSAVANISESDATQGDLYRKNQDEDLFAVDLHESFSIKPGAAAADVAPG